MLREVEKLLDEGKAVGSKPLSDYLEVKGYGEAALWVYGQALEPGAYATGRLLTLQEVRGTHHRAMTPVWDVAPHPQATDQESPGNYRRHEIAMFPSGRSPGSADAHRPAHVMVVALRGLRSKERLSGHRRQDELEGPGDHPEGCS